MSKRSTVLFKAAMAVILGVAVVDKSIMAWHDGGAAKWFMAALFLFGFLATMSNAIDAARRR